MQLWLKGTQRENSFAMSNVGCMRREPPGETFLCSSPLSKLSAIRRE